MIPRGQRVVVTGIGLVTPLGCGNVEVWERLLNGDSGVLTTPENIFPADPSVKVYAPVKRCDFDANDLFGSQSSRYRSTATHYALHASDIALQNAGFKGGCDLDLKRCGVALASGMGSLQDIRDGSHIYNTSPRRLSPFFVSKILISSTAGEISIRNKLQGPNHAVATACAASCHAIGDAFNFIRLGYADFMVAGGTEAALDPLAVSGFAKMRALSRSSDPRTASRPFDENRDGFVIGEGSGVLILETLGSATKRGANIIAEVVGYGLSGDGHHITSPPEDGDGAFQAMKIALQDAGIDSSAVEYINAHATSTPTGDLAELRAISSMCSLSSSSAPELYLSSTKGATGHLLGAAGAVEAAFACLSLNSQSLPPTLNLKTPVSVGDVGIKVNRKITHVVDPNFKPASGLNFAMSNSFGFGGTNASLVFKRYDDR